MTTTEPRIDIMEVNTAALSELQQRAHHHLVRDRHQGDEDRRLAAARRLHAAGAFDVGLSDDDFTAKVEAFLAADTLDCSAGKDRFRAMVFDTYVTYDQFRLVDADPGWECTGKYHVDHDDHAACWGGLLKYEVRRAATGVWEQTWKAACQRVEHRIAMTDKVKEECGERMVFVEEGNEACTRLPLLFSEPGTEPTTPIRPFFADQRRTVLAEDIRNDVSIDAGQRFVTVEALLDAIKEYKDEYDLCDPGVNAFLDEFGLSLTRKYRTELLAGGSGGPVITTFTWTGTSPDQVEDLSLSNLDRFLTAAVDREVEDLPDGDCDGFDVYFGATIEIDDD